MTKLPIIKTLSCLGVLAALGITSSSAQVIWDGGNATRNMADADNWVGNVAPTSNIDTVIQLTGNQGTGEWIFPTATGSLNQNLGNNFQINSLQFSGTYTAASSAYDYRLQGNSFDFRTNSSAVGPTIVWDASMPSSVNYTVVPNITFTDTVTMNGSATGGGFRLQGVISGNGGFIVNRGVTLLGNNTYTGATTVNSGGALNIDVSTGLFSNSDISVLNGGALSIRSNSNSPGLTYDETLDIQSGGTLAFTRRLVNFTGDVTLNGTARGSSAATDEAVVFAAGSQLSGNGSFTQTGTNTLDGGVTINGTVSPGNSGSGILSFNNDISGTPLNVTIGATGDYLWQLTALSETGAGTNFDQLSFTGSQQANLTLISGAELVLSLGGLAPNFGDTFWLIDRSWTVINNTSLGSLTGTFGAIDNSAWSANGTFSTSVVGNDMVLNWVAIPEPSTWLLLAGGLMWVVVLRRRRLA